MMIRAMLCCGLLATTALAAPKPTPKPSKSPAKAKAKPTSKPAASSALAEPSKATEFAKAEADEKLPESRKDDEAQRTYGDALRAFQKGDLAGARRGYQRVLELAPENIPALLNLALVEQREQKHAEAEQHLKRIVRKDPENPSAWLLLGIGAYQQEKLDAAHAHLAQAVLYAPKNVQARQYLGVTLGRKGWYSAGEEELRRALEIDSKFADAHYNLAVLYMERVPPAVELARRHYQKALENGAAPDPDLAKKIGD